MNDWGPHMFGPNAYVVQQMRASYWVGGFGLVAFLLGVIKGRIFSFGCVTHSWCTNTVETTNMMHIITIYHNI